MLGGTLALLTRTLRGDARSLRSHLFRLGFVGMICCSMFVAHVTSLMRGAPGREFFLSIAYLNFVLITLAGIGFFASAITEEKEEETLGLLKMAGISRAGLLLGKSTSRLLIAALLLLVQLPFTLLAITLGGVTLRQVLATYLALVAYMALVANLALLFSVWCRRSGTAATVTGVLVIGYLILAPLGPEIVSAAGLVPGTDVEQFALTFVSQLYASSIVTRIGAIMTTGFNETAVSMQVQSNLAGALACFVLAWLTFELRTGDHQQAAPARGLLPRPTGMLRFLGAGRVSQPPLVWKDFHFLVGGWCVAAIKFVIYGIIAAAIAYLARLEFGLLSVDQFGQYTALAMLSAVGVELTVYSAVIFQNAVRWNTLPALTMLPVSLAGLCWQKVAGCVLGLMPAFCWLALGAVCNPSAALMVVLSPFFWYGSASFVIFLHLTTLLSLFVKWGALPLSIALMAVFNQCCPVFTFGFLIAALGQEHSWGAPLALTAIFIYAAVIIVPLQLAIAKRLQVMSTQ